MNEKLLEEIKYATKVFILCNLEEDGDQKALVEITKRAARNLCDRYKNAEITFSSTKGNLAIGAWK